VCFGSNQVLTQQPHSTKTDIWSMGLVIYQMCTLQLPFKAECIDELMVKVHQLPQPIVAARFRPELVQLVSDMMAVAPEHRPAAADILATPWLAEIGAEWTRAVLNDAFQRQATEVLLNWKQQRDGNSSKPTPLTTQ
jgi:serine/threonine protein kinase